METRFNILEKHAITEAERAKMIDWMLLIKKALKNNISNKSLFTTIKLMDNYFYECARL